MMIFPIDELLDEQRCYDFLLKRSGHVMTTATASAKSTATPWKVSGLVCATSYAFFVVFTRSTWLSMLPCLSGHTISSRSRQTSSEV